MPGVHVTADGWWGDMASAVSADHADAREADTGELHQVGSGIVTVRDLKTLLT